LSLQPEFKMSNIWVVVSLAYAQYPIHVNVELIHY
jgi:hypothetical protein